MAVYIETAKPATLLADFKTAVKDGKIRTWSVDDDGDLTHDTDQWRFKAWLRPRVKEGQLAFFILAPKDTNISKATYAVYHGRIIEAFLTHFDTVIRSGKATALPVAEDRVKS
jgi:hypothetical protein